MRTSSVLVALAAGCCTVGANFVNPPDSAAQIADPVYKLGDLVRVAWETDIKAVDLVLWQTGDNANYSALASMSIQNPTFCPRGNAG